MKKELIESVQHGMKFWWVAMATGLLCIIMGIWCFITPDKSLSTLKNPFLFVFLAAGLLEIIFAMSNRSVINTLGKVKGFIDLLFAVLLLVWPLSSTLIVSVWILLRSVFAIDETSKLRQQEITGRTTLMVFAAISMLASLFLFLSLFFFVDTVVAIAGAISFLSYGIFKIYEAFQFRLVIYEIYTPVEDTI